MPRSVLTGTRIRDRRLIEGVRQADLARQVGISPSYLNLIEHNRRSIGGKLLTDLAQALGVDPSALSEGAGAALVTGLGAAASELAQARGGDGPEVDRAEEFAGRFPGWAGLVTSAHRRMRRLERMVETLTDRLAHDPNLSASLHEVLSTVTAIRSTADILAGSGDIDPNWQARFLKNIKEDADRLSDGAEALVGFLDNAPDADRSLTSPQEELESWLAESGYHIAALEAGGDVDAVQDAVGVSSDAARAQVRTYLERYRADAVGLPLMPLVAAAKDYGFDPARMASELGVGLSLVLRRLATLPKADDLPEIGRVACDGSGALTFRKPVLGFDMPRFGAACALWPLYQAMMRVSVPLRIPVGQVGRTQRPYVAYALAEARYPGGFAGPAILEAQMVLVPSELSDDAMAEAAVEVGQTCRLCPKAGCVARRDASLLGDIV